MQCHNRLRQVQSAHPGHDYIGQRDHSLLKRIPYAKVRLHHISRNDDVATATLTSKGQITIPKSIREVLKLETGDRVEFLVGADGGVTVWPVTENVSTLKGMLAKPKRPVSVEELNRAIRRGRS